jgi:hypothetical protein
MEENRHDRDHLHRVSKGAPSVNKCVTFAAILDLYGRIIATNLIGVNITIAQLVS